MGLNGKTFKLQDFYSILLSRQPFPKEKGTSSWVPLPIKHNDVKTSLKLRMKLSCLLLKKLAPLYAKK